MSLALPLVGAAAFATSVVTFFSGFGLSTLLMPVLALFFPVPIAVASTAVVHGANNLFKLVLLRRHARRDVILRFGLPAIGAAVIGATLLGALSAQPEWFRWELGGRTALVTPVKLIMGMLILGFAVVEMSPGLEKWRFSPRWLPVGGGLSGFFGGLSGHQGAFRAAFLASLELNPSEFAATQATLASIVDAARLLAYCGGALFASRVFGRGDLPWDLVVVASLCAFAGALVAQRLLPRVTINVVRRLTGGLLIIVGIALAAGLV